MTDNLKQSIINELAETRQPLLNFLGTLASAQWQTQVQSEDATWSVADITRHLVSAEFGMTTLIEQFKLGNDPVPADFDRERYNKRVVEKQQDMTAADLLANLSSNRVRLLSIIDSLQPDDWQKQGRHASLRIMTIEEVCHTIAGHEVAHRLEMETAVAAVQAQEIREGFAT